MYTSAYGIRTVALRFANVYGPGMSAKDSIVARLMQAAVAGEGLTVYGAGQQVRDYVYVEDVVAAIQLGLANEKLSGPLTIGASASYTVLDVLELARAATGAPLPAHHVEAPSGEMPRVVATPPGPMSMVGPRRWIWLRGFVRCGNPGRRRA